MIVDIMIIAQHSSLGISWLVGRTAAVRELLSDV